MTVSSIRVLDHVAMRGPTTTSSITSAISASEANPHSLLVGRRKTTHLLNYALVPLHLQVVSRCIIIYMAL
jgi:hypothetical protein